MARSTRLALTISLLANVFLVGAIGGGLIMLSQPEGLRPRIGAPPRPIRAAGEGLPAPDRQRFRQTMLQVLQDNRDLPRDARENRRMAAQLFVQPQFDRAAVAAALGRARDADVQLRTQLETAALDFAATLPSVEREILAEGLERGGPLRHPMPRNGAGTTVP